MKNACVVTTIHKPTKATEKLYELFGDNLIIVADQKTPADWNYKTITPIKVEEKLYAPSNHYARKNAGYLEAIRKGATSIVEADDDSCPNDKWILRSNDVEANEGVELGWYNVYKALSDEHIWPRGFSLRELSSNPTTTFKKFRTSSIQQELVDGDPDVDAIWRLVLKKEHSFIKDMSVYLKPFSWCPFNSQATQWFPKAYPLMYLPVYSPFRMCDIWRSFVAQRCLWEMVDVVTFHSPSKFFQERNEHDLINDFEDEIEGYLKNDFIVELLSELKLKSGVEFVCENLLTCYTELVRNNILPSRELLSVKEWIIDYENIVGIME